MSGIAVVVLIGEARKAGGQIAQLLPDDSVIVSTVTPDDAMEVLEQFTERVRQEDTSVWRLGDFHVDIGARRVMWRDADVDLTPHEFALVAALVAQPGHAVPYEELIPRAWGTDHRADRDMLRSAIRRLRRKLAVVEAGVVIEAVRGFGFRLAEPPATPIRMSTQP